MTTYKVISNKYQTTGKCELDEFDSMEEAKEYLNAIAKRKEKNGYNVDELDNGVIEVTHDDLAEVTAYYILTVPEEVEEFEENEF